LTIANAAQRPGLAQALGTATELMVELTKQFLELEGLSARTIVLDTIQSDKCEPSREQRALSFNLFDIEIDYVAGSVSVEEVVSPCRHEVVPLAAFLDVLGSLEIGRQGSSGGA
jgi:hypothetical protein